MAADKNYFQVATGRAKRVKNPWNLLHLPFSIAGIGCCMWVFLQAVLFVVGLLGSRNLDLKKLLNDDGVHGFIFIGLFFAALPFGMMFSNLVFWIIPPLRRIEDREAVGHKGTDFRNSMKGLFVFAGFSVPLGLATSSLVILFGR
jgi:hypothetical protein